MSLDKCEQDVYKKGVTIGVAWGHKKAQAEKLTRRASFVTGVKVDWYYVGGVPVIVALGDIQKAISYLRRYRKHNQRNAHHYRITVYGVREIENQKRRFEELVRSYETKTM